MPKKPTKLKVSARKRRVSSLSPHHDGTEEADSPQVTKNVKKQRKGEFFTAALDEERAEPCFTPLGHSDEYATAFTNSYESFWTSVESLRQTQGGSINERVAQGRAALNNVSWLANKANFLFTPNFVLRFVDAVRDKHCPRHRGARARFLGDSLGADAADGTDKISARQSRDICGEQRAEMERQSKQNAAEFYIMCCGKKRWTVNRVCPDCNRSPFPLLLGSGI